MVLQVSESLKKQTGIWQGIAIFHVRKQGMTSKAKILGEPSQSPIMVDTSSEKEHNKRHDNLTQNLHTRPY